MCGSQTDKSPPTEAKVGGCSGFIGMVIYVATDGSICSCGVLLSLVSFPQIQPSEGAAAQTPLAANTGLHACPGAQAGVRDGDGCTRGHGTGGHSCARPPCVRLTSVTVSDSMLRSCSCSSGMHCSHQNKTNNSTQATFMLNRPYGLHQLSVC